MAGVQKVVNLNALCPYYTMYPLDFPLRVLANRTHPQEWILDPFCGRGTTNFAARLVGLSSVGIDSSPIAVAIAMAKFLRVPADAVVAAAEAALAETNSPLDIPEGEFWSWAYHEDTLGELCRLRAALMLNCDEPARIMLRAIILGALHGPVRKGKPSYFSNQSPRTFAPKPAYAVRFWKKQGILPPCVKALNIIQRKASVTFPA
jgi:hypothetical protein